MTALPNNSLEWDWHSAGAPYQPLKLIVRADRFALRPNARRMLD